VISLVSAPSITLNVFVLALFACPTCHHSYNALHLHPLTPSPPHTLHLHPHPFTLSPPHPLTPSPPGKDFKELAHEIFAVLPDGEVSLEVVSTAADGMIQEADTLLQWAPKVRPPCRACDRLAGMCGDC
jgi:hypothetical protein